MSSSDNATSNPQEQSHEISDIFDPQQWKTVKDFENLTDITYHRAIDPQSSTHQELPIVRIAFNRPEVRNAFRPQTVDGLYAVLEHARQDTRISTVLITGNGPGKDGGYAFCSGGDQRVRGKDGYNYSSSSDLHQKAPLGRLHILEVQRLIRTMPKVVIAMVNGWAAGGGHSLHVVCDLTIASREHGKFKQTDATVGSFDAGYGSALLAKQVGQKRAREIFFLAQTYTAEEMKEMGAVNKVSDHQDLENLGIEMGLQISKQSPQAIRMLKFAFNLTDDGLAGQQVFAGEATRLAYMTDEAAEGKQAFLEKRDPQWNDFPYYF